MADYTLRDDIVPADELENILATGGWFDETFAVDLTGMMQDYNDAIDWLLEDVIFGGNEWELENWSFRVVGFENDNILHIRVTGDLVRA